MYNILKTDLLKNGNFRLLWDNIWPYRKVLTLALALMLAESAVALINPWMAGLFADSLSSEMPELTFKSVLLIWFGILIVQAILSIVNRYLVSNTGEKLLARLRVRLYDHIQALPLNYFHDRRRGDSLTLLTNDSDNVGQFVTGTLLDILPHLITFLGALVLIYFIYPFAALIAGLAVPLFFLVMKILGRKIRPLSRAMIDEYSNTFSVAEENLQLLPIIKSFTREAIESQRFRKSNQRLLKYTSRFLKIQSILSPLVYLIAATGILLLLWFAGGQLESGELTIAELVSLILYGLLLARPMSSLADVYGQIQRTLGATERLVDIFAISPEPGDIGYPALPVVKGAIEISNVSFAYPGRESILNDLDVSITAGETVAITGENGAGKSTITYLLNRFADPQQGKIFIDGTDISSVNLSSLRSQIGVVQQEVLLLNGTIRENIEFGRPGADYEAVETAAREAHAIDFINKLPNGFDTVTGDQGVKLSGGQRQRLALARALLKEPPILILDEATAMFDPKGEKKFIEECHDTLHNRTVILITHRPASLALADRILELKNGKLIPVEFQQARPA